MDWLVVVRMNSEYQRFKPPLYGREITMLTGGCLQTQLPRIHLQSRLDDYCAIFDKSDITANY